MRCKLFNVLPRALMDIHLSLLPNEPFDINSLYLRKRSIYYYGEWWEEFFIPTYLLPNFLKGQAERDGIRFFSISKSRPIGKQQKDDETNADASPDVGQSEEAGDRLATTARKEVRM